LPSQERDEVMVSCFHGLCTFDRLPYLLTVCER
jgi:hypothetical protein